MYYALELMKLKGEMNNVKSMGIYMKILTLCHAFKFNFSIFKREIFFSAFSCFQNKNNNLR